MHYVAGDGLLDVCIRQCLLTFCSIYSLAASLSLLSRVIYGPDSIHAEFDADTCSEILGLPTCGAWLPDESSFVKLLTHDAPPFLGAWCLIGIVAASMSTADGAILAMGTVRTLCPLLPVVCSLRCSSVLVYSVELRCVLVSDSHPISVDYRSIYDTM